MKKWEISRRTFLRGLGATIALPVLDAMIPSMARAADPLQRLGVIYFPSGMYGGDKYGGKRMGSWVPNHTSLLSSAALPVILDPMKGLIKDFSVLSGLDVRSAETQVAGGEGSHARAGCSFLVCQPKKQRSVVDIDTSMDQIIAEQLNRGKGYKYSSIVLAGSPGGNFDGPHPDYCGHISYANRVAVPKSVNPQQTFDMIFGGLNNAESAAAIAERTRSNKSILDFIRGDTASLKRKLGKSDTLRMDEYLESIRQIEKDLLSMSSNGGTCPTQTRPSNEFNLQYLGPERYQSGLNLMVDMMVASFQCNLTPVSTLMLDIEGSDRLLEKTIDPKSYLNLVVRERAHNDNAHWTGDAARVDRLISINRFQLGFFERLVSKMKAIKEPTGTLLDNSLLLYGCGISDGANHSHRNLPILLAGGSGLGLNPGRHINYSGLPLANLHLTLMQKMGLNVKSFADSTGTLNNL